MLIIAYYRYLIHRFKDLYRQAAIDIQLGQPLEPHILQLLTRGQTETGGQDEIDYIRYPILPSSHPI